MDVSHSSGGMRPEGDPGAGVSLGDVAGIPKETGVDIGTLEWRNIEPILGLPGDYVILTALFLSVFGLLASLFVGATRARVGEDGLPHPNWTAIIGTVLVGLVTAVTATSFVMQLYGKVETAQRDIERLRLEVQQLELANDE